MEGGTSDPGDGTAEIIHWEQREGLGQIWPNFRAVWSDMEMSSPAPWDSRKEEKVNVTDNLCSRGCNLANSSERQEFTDSMSAAQTPTHRNQTAENWRWEPLAVVRRNHCCNYTQSTNLNDTPRGTREEHVIVLVLASFPVPQHTVLYFMSSISP